MRKSIQICDRCGVEIDVSAIVPSGDSTWTYLKWSALDGNKDCYVELCPKCGPEAVKGLTGKALTLKSNQVRA